MSIWRNLRSTGPTGCSWRTLDYIGEKAHGTDWFHALLGPVCLREPQQKPSPLGCARRRVSEANRPKAGSLAGDKVAFAKQMTEEER